MTTLTLTDWLNFGVASIEAEKMFIGLGPELARFQGPVFARLEIKNTRLSSQFLCVF